MSMSRYHACMCACITKIDIEEDTWTRSQPQPWAVRIHPGAAADAQDALQERVCAASLSDRRQGCGQASFEQTRAQGQLHTILCLNLKKLFVACMCVCMYVSYVRMYVCVCVCVCMYVCMCACMRACI